MCIRDSSGVEVLRRPFDFTLDPSVAVVDQAVEDLACSGAIPDGHLQGVDGEIRAQAVGDLPADHQARVHVDDERRVHPPGVGLYIGEVGDPQPVRARGLEVPLRRKRRRRHAQGHSHPARRALQDDHLGPRSRDGQARDVYKRQGTTSSSQCKF